MATPTKQARRGGRTTDNGRDTEQTTADAEESVRDETTAGKRSSKPTAMHAHAAAVKATRRNSTQVTVPLLGTVNLPAADELAFLAGMGVLTVVGAIEWPIAVVLAVGHTLAANRRNKVIREFGEALEKA
jgi:hypothetical protein